MTLPNISGINGQLSQAIAVLQQTQQLAANGTGAVAADETLAKLDEVFAPLRRAERLIEGARDAADAD